MWISIADFVILCHIPNNMINRFKRVILLGGDILLLYVTLYLALFLRHQHFPTHAIWNENFWPFTLLFVVWVGIFYINGLYEIFASKNDVEFYNKILRNLLLNFGFGIAYFYLLTDKLFDIKPQTVFLIFSALFTVIFLGWRFWYNSFVKRPTMLKNVLVLGMNDEARELVEEIIKKPQLGFRISAIIHDGYRANAEFPGVEIFNSSIAIKKLLKKNNIETVVTVLDPQSNPELLRQLFDSLSLRLQFFDLPSFYEKLTGKIPVTNIGHIWFLENLAESEKQYYEGTKRIIDLLASLVGGVISLVFLPFLALLVKSSSPGPVFFKQMRVGAGGKPFLAIKLRTMYTDAEKDGQPQWAAKDDPRITRIGKFLRKTRLDEIPQLLNVLRGDMSIVGPRPERPEFVRQLQELIPFYNERHLIRPGLTGWAQINFQYGASAGDALKKLQYDLFYVKNRSLILDAGIILKTLNIIFSGKGR